jgi:2-oxoglutarate ferredoxin oxidoreductase subunit alpha
LLEKLANEGKEFLVVELNAGQMVQDVSLATGNMTTVEHFGRLGGNVPSAQEIVSKSKEILEKC